MTKTKHAEVTQEYRDLASRIEKECFRRFGDRGWATFDTSLAGQLLADHDAQVERKARLDDARRWERFHYGHPPEGEEAYWNQKRIAELGGTK